MADRRSVNAQAERRFTVPVAYGVTGWLSVKAIGRTGRSSHPRGTNPPGCGVPNKCRFLKKDGSKC